MVHYLTKSEIAPPSVNGSILSQKIKELSVKRWGKEIVILSDHSTFLKTLQKLEQFAQSDEPVLLTGESGVGKELFASSLYLLSQRNGRSYVCVNCGQFNDEHLMVSELFGHAKGSFTGAIHDHQGVFESANGGTIFLDEIGELPPSAQKMLLRVIDQKEIMPLGSTRVKAIDIRVISATHRDLESMVETGFRVCDSNVISLDDITEKLQHRRKSDLLPLDISDYYSRIVDKGESFWEVIREPFMNRDLSRCQVKAIIQKGLQEAVSYKGLSRIFNIQPKDHKKSLNFLQQHNLKQ